MNERDFLLGELKGMFSSQKTYMCERFDKLENKNTEQDGRITKLEKKSWYNRVMSGFGGIIGGFVAIITLNGFKQ